VYPTGSQAKKTFLPNLVAWPRAGFYLAPGSETEAFVRIENASHRALVRYVLSYSKTEKEAEVK
jgi:hypothetical protein